MKFAKFTGYFKNKPEARISVLAEKYNLVLLSCKILPLAKKKATKTVPTVYMVLLNN